MKYNPIVNEIVTALPGLAQLRPLIPDEYAQGGLELVACHAHSLPEISGMDAISLQSADGAQSELTGMKLIRAYHESNKDPRKKVLIPSSGHGTNPASAASSGHSFVEVPA